MKEIYRLQAPEDLYSETLLLRRVSPCRYTLFTGTSCWYAPNTNACL